MRTQTLPLPVMDALRECPPLYQLLKTVRWHIGSSLGARSLPGVKGRVHYNDFMLVSSAQHDVDWYVQGATNFIRILADALKRSGKSFETAENWLEIGCGYGRIVRALVEKVLADHVWVCDAIEEASAFCADEFRVRRVSCAEVGKAEYCSRFDVVYLLSVFTHLDQVTIADNWRAIVSALRPGGIVVLTMHGPVSARQMENYGWHWKQRKPRVMEALLRDGYYYEKYRWYRENIGMTWFKCDRFRQVLAEATAPGAGMSELYFMEAGLDGHQDVFVFQKAEQETVSKQP